MNAQAPPAELVETVLAVADDELVLGWRDSEWTGIAPFLEEDVALSSIAQGEIGHARALYELVAAELGGDADALAFDRDPAEYRSASLVEERFVPDWARTVARRWLYEAADEVRLAALSESRWPALAGLAAKMDREEAYHRLHAGMWRDRLAGDSRFQAAVEELWPHALGLVEPGLRGTLRASTGLPEAEAIERGAHADDWPALHEEMTMVRRSAPGSAW